MKKPKTFICPVFRVRVEIFYNWSLKKYSDYIEKNYQVKEDHSGHAGTTMELFNGERTLFTLWVRDGKDNQEFLVHECNHLKNLIFKYVGQKPDSNNDEFESYYLQMLFREAKKKS